MTVVDMNTFQMGANPESLDCELCNLSAQRYHRRKIDMIYQRGSNFMFSLNHTENFARGRTKHFWEHNFCNIYHLSFVLNRDLFIGRHCNSILAHSRVGWSEEFRNDCSSSPNFSKNKICLDNCYNPNLKNPEKTNEWCAFSRKKYLHMFLL